MDEKYFLLTYYVHSCLERGRTLLVVDENTTVDNFRNNQINEEYVLSIFEKCLDKWHYELSWNQTELGIMMFLDCRKQK